MFGYETSYIFTFFYTCGPPARIKAMQDIIQNDSKVPKDRTKFEEFIGY